MTSRKIYIHTTTVKKKIQKNHNPGQTSEVCFLCSVIAPCFLLSSLPWAHSKECVWKPYSVKVVWVALSLQRKRTQNTKKKKTEFGPIQKGFNFWNLAPGINFVQYKLHCFFSVERNKTARLDYRVLVTRLSNIKPRASCTFFQDELEKKVLIV